MKPKLTDLLKLSWDELKVVLVAEIRAALGEKGPWKHEPRERSMKTTEERCCRCDARRGVRLGFEYEITDYTPWMSELTREDVDCCPVPPPITDPPEVMAEKLIKKCDLARLEWETQRVWSLLNPGIRMSWWFGYRSSASEKCFIALLALDKVALGEIRD